VRRSALPRPGTDEQLRELVARLQSRRLDRDRPLWETYLVEGLSGDRFAVITKTHHAMVDGVGAVDIAQVILDVTPQPRDSPPDTWRPSPEPSWAELVAGAVAETVRRPTALLDTARSGAADVRTTAGRLLGTAGGLLAMARTAARPAPESPLNAQVGEQRRYGMAATSLDDYKRVRKAHSPDGSITVNDVVLATVSGALRSWLMTRGEAVTPTTVVRALVPVSVRTAAPGGEPPAPPDEEHRFEPGGALGNRVSAYLVDLPVGEPSAAMRLHQVAYAMRGHKETGQAIGAEVITGIVGFAPPTLHALGARVASGLSRRMFNLVVTNVPGPQFPLYAGGAQMLAAYPVVPLAKGQAVSIGLTSYDGGVYYGLNADRDAMADVDVLAGCLLDALGELLETVR
jgi:WS/DGAT/MGAT family acyltransferase